MKGRDKLSQTTAPKKYNKDIKFDDHLSFNAFKIILLEMKQKILGIQKWSDHKAS